MNTRRRRLARFRKVLAGRGPGRLRFVPAVLVGTAAATAVSLAAAGWFVWSLFGSLPDQDAIGRIGEMAEATAVFDSTDRLAFTIYKEQRLEVPLEAISTHVVDAIVAIEDQRFYEHRGFDLVRIAAAALANVRLGRAAQGGSTITQQLARQSFLTTDKTFRRKIQELILAGRLEDQYDKRRILELYLNKVYFGDGFYGIEAASRGFFGKHAAELPVAEAAMLAGLVQSPSTYAPTVSLPRAIARRDVVLRAMLETGAIDRETWEAARAATVVLHDSLRAEEPYGQYFKEQARRELVARFGSERVYQGGLRVYTTLDPDMQRAAEAAVEEGLRALEARRTRAAARTAKPAGEAEGDPLQAALVAMDPASGHVRAMVGGRNFAESHFNRAVQARRQPGSAFKPFVYAAALEAGLTPATMIQNLNAPISLAAGDWTPEDEHSTADALSLRSALRTSSNRAAVQLLQQVGIPRAVDYARSLGVGDVPAVPSLALGSGEVTLQALTAAYAAFANRGLVVEPVLIRRVEDRAGEVLFAAEPRATPAVSETTAFLMASMLADVLDSGTAAGARRMGFTLPAAGKTGTTNDFKDAWFVGFTPTLVAGVWVGFDQPRPILRNGFAAEVAVPLWAGFMKAATRGQQAAWLRPPSAITTATVCRLSGHLATEGCEHVEVLGEDGRSVRRSMAYTEYFVNGSEPRSVCTLHPTRGFIGALAAVFAGGSRPAPPVVREADLPAEVVRPSPAPFPTPKPHPPAADAEPSPRRRGFWSRVLGIGREDPKEPEKRRRDPRQR